MCVLALPISNIPFENSIIFLTLPERPSQLLIGLSHTLKLSLQLSNKQLVLLLILLVLLLILLVLLLILLVADFSQFRLMGEELVSRQFDDKFVLVGQFLLVLLDGLVLFVQLACYRLDVL